jgi:hypothetical protein
MLRAALAWASLILLGACSADVCDYDIRQTVASPSGKLSAIVFVRDCEAPAGVSTQVSILPTGQALPDEPGNAFASYGSVDLSVKWTGERALLIRDPQSGLTRQTVLPTSSATSSAPRESMATPTGRP